MLHAIMPFATLIAMYVVCMTMTCGDRDGAGAGLGDVGSLQDVSKNLMFVWEKPLLHLCRHVMSSVADAVAAALHNSDAVHIGT